MALLEAQHITEAKDLDSLVSQVETALGEKGEIVVLLNSPHPGGDHNAGTLLRRPGEAVEGVKRTLLWRRAGTPHRVGDEPSWLASRVWKIFSAITGVPSKRTLYLSRHGQSEFNVDDRYAPFLLWYYRPQTPHEREREKES